MGWVWHQSTYLSRSKLNISLLERCKSGIYWSSKVSYGRLLWNAVRYRKSHALSSMTLYSAPSRARESGFRWKKMEQWMCNDFMRWIGIIHFEHMCLLNKSDICSDLGLGVHQQETDSPIFNTTLLHDRISACIVHPWACSVWMGHRQQEPCFLYYN